MKMLVSIAGTVVAAAAVGFVAGAIKDLRVRLSASALDPLSNLDFEKDGDDVWRSQ